MLNLEFTEHWVTIQTKTCQGGDVIETIQWKGLPFKVRMKFDWYFKYREALLRVKHPKAHTELRWGHNVISDTEKLENWRKNKIIAKKRTLTKYENAMSAARATWNELFPIETDADYIKCMAKIEKTKAELEWMETNPNFNPDFKL